jgi:hypothetical protein
MKTFVEAVSQGISGGTKYLILGDSHHGLKSLEALANSVKSGKLNLNQIGVKCVFFEGAEQGFEEVAGNGAFKAACSILMGHGIIPMGCETSETMGSASYVDALISDAMQGSSTSLGSDIQGLLDTRVIKANEEWSNLLRGFGPGSILCCGSSHLPSFSVGQEDGLQQRLGGANGCSAFVIETPNAGDGSSLYFPEIQTGKFGGIEAIREFQ